MFGTFNDLHTCCRDLFNECVIHASAANSHVTKRERDKQSPRLQSRLESISAAQTPDFIPDGECAQKCL